MAKYKYIHCDVYKRGVTVFIGDCDSLRNWVKKFYKESYEQDMVDVINRSCSEEEYNDQFISARCYESNSGQWVVHLPEFSFTYDPIEIADLAHELLHATHGLLDFIGVEYRYGGANEPYTYLYEYLLKNALTEKGYKNVE